MLIKKQFPFTMPVTVPALLLISVFLLLSSCANRGLVRAEKLREPLGQGNYELALQKVKSSYKLYKDKDAFLWHFDQGVLYHYLGEFDSSLVHLKTCESILDDLYAVSVTNEALSFMTNDLNRPYRSRPYEISAMYSLLVLNYLAKGQSESAAVEARKAQLVFAEWFRQDESKYNEDGFFQYLAAITYLMEQEKDNARISSYKAARAYLENTGSIPKEVAHLAWYLHNQDNRSADIETLGLQKPDDFSLQTIKQLASSHEEIIVIGYAGRIPLIGEKRLSGMYISGAMLNLNVQNADGSTGNVNFVAPFIPAEALTKYKLGQGVSTFITFTLPEYLPQPYRVTGMQTIFENQVYSSSTIKDFGDNLKQNLKDTEAETLKRTILRVAIKTAVAEIAKGAVASQTDDPIIQLLLNLATDAGSAALENADTRLSFFLPRNIQIMRIPAEPGTHSLAVQIRDTSGATAEQKLINDIEVVRGKKTFVFVPALY
jgi:uncharacterized protein